jgi:septum site-determining protein MinC
MRHELTIKGRGDLLVITVPEGNWEGVRPDLLEAMDERADFLRGAQVALEIPGGGLGAAQLSELRQAVADRGMTLEAILTDAESTRSAAADLGLALQLRPTAAELDEDMAPLPSDLHAEDAVLVRRTIRSGHSIRHPGHVVVIGDVNPGAEIIAGGHVVVWGRLRGVVHAGASGNEEAVVCALDLSPTQLRIAGQIAVSPARRGKARPETARIHQGSLVAEDWLGERQA